VHQQTKGRGERTVRADGGDVLHHFRGRDLLRLADFKPEEAGHL